MRLMPTLCAVFLTAATPALAQVTVDLHALQALPDHPPAAHPPFVARPPHVATPKRPVPKPAAREAAAAGKALKSGGSAVARTRTAQPGTHPGATTKPGSAVQSAAAANPSVPSQPALPATAPAAPALDTSTPPAAGAAPPPPPVSAKASTSAAATAAGLRLTFAAGQSDLNPDSAASIKHLVTATPRGDETTFNVDAYAPGKPDDPSTARRLSLSRAMAVRDALIADGVPSSRIFVRALGEQYGNGPPDRVDIGVSGIPKGAASAQ